MFRYLVVRPMSAIMLPALALVIVQTPSVAQNKRADIYKKNPGYDQWQKQHIESEKNAPLFTAPDLAELPRYPHKTKFLGGMVYKNAGPSYFFQFTAMEEQKPIIDWYKNAFASSNWEVKKSNKTTIIANMNSSSSDCVISVKPDRAGNGRTTVSVQYTAGSKFN